MRQLHDGDRVGCLIDMKDNSATFFTNDIKQARITYPGLSKSPLYPALSLGLGAIVQISEPHRVPIIK